MTREYRTRSFKQALEQRLPWPTIDEVFEAARAFQGPVLEGLSGSRWDPEAWSWTGAGE